MNVNNVKPPQIAICGATGFIGQALSRFFSSNGYKIIPITRNDIKQGSDCVARKIEGASILINLAGAPILNRWTDEYKKEIYNSRIITTRVLVGALQLLPCRPGLFISTSAVGIYNQIDIHDEFSELLADDFLGQVCRDWEHEAFKVMDMPDVRLVVFRFGVVLSMAGGAFPRMVLPFRLFAGGHIGTGMQWFPFVHIKDLLSAFWFVVTNKKTQGIYNLTAPVNITNRKFSSILARVMHRPCWLTVPEKILHLVYGDAAQMLTQGQYIKAYRLVHDGFFFEFSNVEKMLADLLSSKTQVSRSKT